MPSIFSTTNIRVLTLAGYYTPGFKAGGPLKTISNMVENIGDDIHFLILTRDRDMGSDEPYENVQINSWNSVGKADVFYASASFFSFFGIYRLLRKTSHNVLYINSFFSVKTTIYPLFVRRLGLYGDIPIVIAPRGEFSRGALQLKSTKKIIYITFAKIIGLYRNLIWQASSEHEAADIRRALGRVARNVVVAPNLLPKGLSSPSGDMPLPSMARESGPLRLVFLSRISPKKNLDYLLRVLGKVERAIQLSIYGPKEDQHYWNQCHAQIQALPSHVSVRYCGEVTPDKVPQVFAESDVFTFPTRGENFGHVIYESLSVGTAVILSDQTPWKASADGAVSVIPLDDITAWATAIEQWSQLDDAQHLARREAALSYANSYRAASPAVAQNLTLFRMAVGQTAWPTT